VELQEIVFLDAADTDMVPPTAEGAIVSPPPGRITFG